MKPEELARQKIDAKLVEADWLVQDRYEMNISAGRGVAVREFKLTNGFVDYVLFVDGQACGAIEANPEDVSLTGVEPQIKNYSEGLPPGLNPPVQPLPFPLPEHQQGHQPDRPPRPATALSKSLSIPAPREPR